jgi:putrescine transport system ATP-binding protein
VLAHDADARADARIAVRQAVGTAAPCWRATPTSLPEGTAVSVVVRPEKIDVHESAPRRPTTWRCGQVRDIAYLGDVSIYHVETESGAVIRVQETHVERSSEPHYDWGETLWLSWPSSGAVVLTA